MQISAKDFLQPGDALVLTFDPATKRQRKTVAPTTLDGGPVTVTAVYQDLADGPTVTLTSQRAQKEIEMTMHTLEYAGAPRPSNGLRPDRRHSRRTSHGPASAVEFHDQPWFPAAWRDVMTQVMQSFAERFRPYRPMVPRLRAALDRCGSGTSSISAPAPPDRWPPWPARWREAGSGHHGDPDRQIPQSGRLRPCGGEIRRPGRVRLPISRRDRAAAGSGGPAPCSAPFITSRRPRPARFSRMPSTAAAASACSSTPNARGSGASSCRCSPVPLAGAALPPPPLSAAAGAVDLHAAGSRARARMGRSRFLPAHLLAGGASPADGGADRRGL